jgi:hypothetical protein
VDEAWYCAGLLFEAPSPTDQEAEPERSVVLTIFQSPVGAEWNVAQAIGQTRTDGQGAPSQVLKKVVDVRPLAPADRIVNGGEVYSMPLTPTALAALRSQLELD